MTAAGFDDLRQHSDILRLRTGKSLTLRFVEPQDAEILQGYFRSLSTRSATIVSSARCGSFRKPNSVISSMPERMIVSA